MSGVEDEVVAIRGQLEKISKGEKDSAQALDLLKNLGQLKMNLSILTTTRIGMTVNALRKSPAADDEVNALAKTLIKAWKKFVPESVEKKKEKREAAAEEAKDKAKGKDASKDAGLKQFPTRPQVKAVKLLDFQKF